MKTWLAKGYTEEEARYQIAIRRPTNVLYFTNKGYSEEEAQIMLKDRQKKSLSSFNELPIEEKRKTKTSCIEYYLEKGMTLEEAENARSERQRTFSRDQCIEKWGEIEGLKIFNERQEKWQSSLNDKSQEEIDEINRSKNRWKDLTDEEIESLKKQTADAVRSTTSKRTIEERKSVGKKIRDGQVSSGRAIAEELMDAYSLYKSKALSATRRNDLSVLENYNKRGIVDYHLDHKYSIFEGFKNGVDVEIIGHIKNLEMIPYIENVSKHTKCSITLEELLTLIEKYK